MAVNIDVKYIGPAGQALQGDPGPEATLIEFVEFIRQNQIRIANAAFAEEKAKGNLKNAFTIIDGKRNASVESVKGLGKIQFVEPLADLNFLGNIYGAILDRSPVDTGLYKSQHYVFLNGKKIAGNASDLASFVLAQKAKSTLKAGDTFQFVNVVPYARKLERYGITAGGQSIRTRKSRDRLRYKGRKFRPVFLAENGPYFLASRFASRKFGRNVLARFELISGSRLADIPSFPKKSGKGNMRTTFAKKGGPYVYPSIRIVLTADGFSGGGQA